jgi:hypothetical protein
MIVQQPIALKVTAHLLDSGRQDARPSVIPAPVSRIMSGIGRRQALERIGKPDLSISHSVRFEDSPHEDRHATTPHASLNNVTRNVFGEDALNTETGIS